MFHASGSASLRTLALDLRARLMASGWNSDVVVMIWFSLLSRLPIFGFAPLVEGEPTKAQVVAIREISISYLSNKLKRLLL
jgi:hypothetical protein